MEGNIPQAPPAQAVQPEAKDISQTPQQAPVAPQTSLNQLYPNLKSGGRQF